MMRHCPCKRKGIVNILSQDIKYLQGVGPNRALLLANELGIKTVGDLLAYYPYKYVDRSRFYQIREIDGAMPYVQLCGQIFSFDTVGEGRNKRLIGHFSDGTGSIDLVWFQGIKYVTKNYDCRKDYVVFGKPTVFNGRIQIAHPEIETLPSPSLQGGNDFSANENADEQGNNPLPIGRVRGGSVFRPSYNTSEKMKRSGLNSSAIAKLTANMFKLLKEPLAETLPPYIVQQHHLMSYDDAVRNIHYPTSPDALRHAQLRLKFEELFYVQLNILRYVKDRQLRYKGIVFNTIGEHFNGFFYNHLPFQLTEAQKRVIREIRADMKTGRQMNRLLQGDVGSGKTLVALMVALIAIDNGHQACIMAPTEILAEQHLSTLRKFLGDMPVRVELLTGSVKGKRRTEVLKGLVTGDIHILVGTHAVIEDNVLFHQLGLVVIDEQHRFGVAQRAKLWMKNSIPPHVLVMTATPIPRTLAMTLYGDLDVSIIDELPPGRKPIRTIHMFDAHRQRIYELMNRELQQGRQIYIVYPLIKETEPTEQQVPSNPFEWPSRDEGRRSQKMDLKDLETGFEEIIPVSAKSGDGVEELITSLENHLPEGPQYFPEDMITDQPERILCAEIIREKALRHLRDEVPHGIGVEIMKIEALSDKLTEINATVYCERAAHKGIIIGKNGAMLQTIGTEARLDIEKLLDIHVNLKLWVKIRTDWRNNARDLKNLGYDS